MFHFNNVRIPENTRNITQLQISRYMGLRGTKLTSVPNLPLKINILTNAQTPSISNRTRKNEDFLLANFQNELDDDIVSR